MSFSLEVLRTQQINTDHDSSTGNQDTADLRPRKPLLTCRRVPDASVSSEFLKEDIDSIAAIGVGGVNIVPHYIFGLPIDGIDPPRDWTKYGYGTPAFQDMFREILKAGQENEMQMDFGLGASQGQGIPAPVGATGLAVQLLAGNETLRAGELFDDVYRTKAITEGSDIRLSAAFSQPGEVVLGQYSISHESSIATSTALEIWDLTISAWHDPPSCDQDAMHVRTHVTEYHFNSTQLLRWSDLDADLAHVSGIGTYRTNFTCPESLELLAEDGRPGAFLSLPPIKHTLHASINGQPLPAFDSIRPLADLTPHLRYGATGNDKNELIVVISTPLPNAVKHELSTAMSIGMTLEMIDERYHDLDWMPHGLLGPVEID